MNYAMRTKHNSRRGVTLLFTISMIVLFLLMGTTFVVVANDYFKTATRRSRLNTLKIDTTAILERAFREAFRGPALNDVSSAMRGVSILEDQYGYGFSGEVLTAGPSATPSLVSLVLDSTNLFRTRTQEIVNLATDDTYADNVYGGHVITFTDGAAEGYSTRIISHTFDPATSQLRIVIPRDTLGINWSLVVTGDDVYVNGRDFAGTGAGTADFGSFLDRDAAASNRLDEVALEPNRIGEPYQHPTLPTILDTYLTSDRSTNEGNDAADYHTMFLSGEDTAGNIIPSFHRDRLYNNRLTDLQTVPTDVTPANVRKFSFRPVYIAGELNSTANENFDSAFNDNGTLVSVNDDGSARPVNDANNLDVDTDNNGENDAVWIDIGLPVQTDSQGRRFRPLVAYYIKDLDGKLNINVHGSHADVAATGDHLGAGFGVAEISLSDITSNYTRLLNQRYGTDNIPGSRTNAFSDADTFSPQKVRQKLFGYPEHQFADLKTGNLFSTGGDIFGVSRVMSRPAGSTNRDDLPTYVLSTSLSGNANAAVSPYDSDFGIAGGVGDQHFEGWELEELLRTNDIDSSLFRGRLDRTNPLVNASDFNKVTTHSFEVAMPSSPLSVVELLRQRCEVIIDMETGGAGTIALVRDRVSDLIADDILAPEVLMGGKFNLNRVLGNGRDDNTNGVVDEPIESAVVERSRQNDQPILDLDNAGNGLTGNARARQLMAKQLFVLNLLVCGESVPTGSTGFTADEYVKSIAQWAVNVVDFNDADSIITVFEYDMNPFNTDFVDGDPSTGLPSSSTPETDRGIVFGFERPELLITETFAHHDRQNQDLDGDGDDVDSGDDDWDSLRIPQSSTFIELYNPWAHRTTTTPEFSLSPGEFDALQTGVDLTATGGTSPVWRIAVKRGDDISDAIIRTIYFSDPTGTPPDGNEPEVTGTAYYPSTTSSGLIEIIEPGDHMVVGSAGNVEGTTRAITTFGRRISEVPTTIPNVETIQGIELVTTTGSQIVTYRDPAGTTTSATCKVAVIDMPRSLSISEPNAGYPASIPDPTSNDGRVLATQVPLDEPLDSNAIGYRLEEDIRAIWANGVRQRDTAGNDFVFRTLHLQRLADPTQDWDINLNPYVSIDSSHVNLLSFNGLNNDPNNNGTIAGVTSSENTVGGLALTAENSVNTEFRTIERGEKIVDDNDIAEARRQFFQIEDELMLITADAPVAGSLTHNFDFNFEQTLGDSNAAHEMDTPLGWLTINNRPFANTMELFNVPASSILTSLSLFNETRTGTTPSASATPAEAFSFYMGQEAFQHVVGYGQTPPGGTNNRFDHILDFVDVPNRFLGSETWIPNGTTAINGTTVTGLTFGMNAPFNSIPTFRYPGKVNINTIYDSDVWDAVVGAFETLSFPALKTVRDTSTGASDFGGAFTSNNGGEFVSDSGGQDSRRGGEAFMFRDNTSGDLFAATDQLIAEGQTMVDNSTYFSNEFRQRISATTTTRSSVFAIWITVGYFEVDEDGRVGAEIGSEDGEVRRNRAFYLVDRSIPVASEPGRNHNVDKAVLVRTIIE